MSDVLLLLLAGSGTALATGIGAVPVFLIGARAERWRPVLLGLPVGLMGVASVVGLLQPALDQGSQASVAFGLAGGIGFLALARRCIDARQRAATSPASASTRSSLLVFAVLFLHSLPEGLAIGTAYASDTAGLGLFVILAIALQNIPEGTSMAIPMEAAGQRAGRQFWVAVGTSAPQPVGALAAFLLVETVESLLPLSFAFAAGAMLALIAVELVPQAFTRAMWRGAAAGAVGGGLAMLALSAALGV